MYGPFTVMDCLKMLWWLLLHPEPTPTRTLGDLKAETDKILEKPIMVLRSPDHTYRQAKFASTTAILCTIKGQKPTLHEDHFPKEPPGPGFDQNPNMTLTRVNVLLVE